MLASFVAAAPMAFSDGGRGPRQPADSSEADGTASAPGGVRGGGAGAPAETQLSGASGPGQAGEADVVLQTGAATGPHGTYGPGDRGDSSISGFMPNGENGLMRLADFAARQADGRAGDNVNQGQPTTGEFSEAIGSDAAGSDGDDGADNDLLKVPPFPLDGKFDAGPSANGGFGGFGGGGGGGGAGGFGGFGGFGGGNGGGGGGGLGGGTPPGASGPTSGPPGGDAPGGPLTFQPPHPDTPLDGCVLTDSCGSPPGGGGTTPVILGPHLSLVVPGGDLPDIQIVPTTVPEPAAWLLMIFGFGAAGQALRAQRRRLRGAAA